MQFLKHHFFYSMPLAALLVLFGANAHAAADKQSFAGGGLGFQVLSNNGSGTGLYLTAEGGYQFANPMAAGIHAGYSNVGGMSLKTFDFGLFGQLTEPQSGFFGRVYLDAVYASLDGGGTNHGVKGNQIGIAPGVGTGLLIPPVGSFHLVPQLAYRAAFLTEVLHLFSGSFNVVWDF